MTELEEFARQYNERVRSRAAKKMNNLYHGTRRVEDVATIKEQGIRTFSCQDLFWRAIRALQDNGALKMLADEGTYGELIRNELSHVCDIENTGFWFDAYDPEDPQEIKEWGKEGRSCGYARRNPETIGLILENARVPPEQLRRYMKEEFGDPVVIKLKHRILGEDINLPSRVSFISPEDIEDVTTCAEEGK